jgi:hypothetical protein
MKPTTMLIVLFWILVVGGNVLSTLTMSLGAFMGAPQFPWFIVFMPLIVIVGAFVRRESPVARHIEKWVDQRSGPGTYKNFMMALKLELMFAAMCFGISFSALARSYIFGSPALPPVLIGFFTSGGVAFVAAYFIRRGRLSLGR